MCFSLCFWRIVILKKKCGVVLFLERKTWLGFYKLSSCRWRLLFCLPNLFNKQWSQDIKYCSFFFFLGPLLFSLHFKYFQPKGYVWERKTYEIFSPILVVFQMRSVCAAVKKDVALMWGSDCLLTLDWENWFSGVVVSGHRMQNGIGCLPLYPALSK